MFVFFGTEMERQNVGAYKVSKHLSVEVDLAI